MEKSLIALTGYKGSGKDTAGRGFTAAGYVEVKFAGGFKAMLRAYLAYRGVDPERIERMMEGDLKEVPCVEFGGKTPRYAQQTLGSEWGRHLIHPDLWVDTALDRAKRETRVVITDCRFPNEAEAVRRAGGKIMRIERPGHPVDLSHESERHIAKIPADITLVNDFDNPQDLTSRIRDSFA